MNGIKPIQIVAISVLAILALGGIALGIYFIKKRKARA
jgi:hypothetical protein